MQVPAPRSEAPKVLLAEDDEPIRRTLESLLEMKGFHASSAVNTSETISLLESDDFDLVISDYLMPGGGGREVLQFINDNGRSTAIIMITGLADERLFSELRAAGVSRCLSKPFRLMTLLETIEEVLAERSRPQ